MYNHEATAHGKLNLKSLLICWLIILGGYLLIRMVFLVFGLQLHLTAQGICLALLPYCFGASWIQRYRVYPRGRELSAVVILMYIISDLFMPSDIKYAILVMGTVLALIFPNHWSDWEQQGR